MVFVADVSPYGDADGGAGEDVEDELQAGGGPDAKLGAFFAGEVVEEGAQD